MTIAFVHCNSAYAACLAYALPLNTMFTTENSAYIPFQVTVTDCRDGCSGWVEYDFQYINGFNVIMSYSSTFQWESDAGEPVTVTEEIPLTSCTEYYGGCREVSVDVTDLPNPNDQALTGSCTTLSGIYLSPNACFAN